MLSVCKITGLVGKPQLNGRAGSVLKYDMVSLRYIVEVEGEDSPVKLKPENVLMPADANTVTTYTALVQKHVQLMSLLAAAESSGKRAHEAALCCEVGTVLKNMQHYEEAAQYHQRAIDANAELQGTEPEEKMHRIDEATFRSNLGICMRRLGRQESAVESLKHALEIAEGEASTANTETLTRGALVAQGMARGNLGATYTSIGSRDDDQSTHELAIEVLERGLAIARQVEHAALEKNILGNLANAHSALQGCIQAQKPHLSDHSSETAGREVALKYSEESLALKRQAGDQPGVANSLLSIGDLLCEMGQHAKAKQHLEEALAIADSLMRTEMSVVILTSLAIQSRRLAAEHKEAGRESEARLVTSEAITYLVKATTIMDTVWSSLSSDSARIKYAAGRQERLQINHMLQQSYVDLSREKEALVCAEAGRAQSLELLLIQQRQQHYHDASGAESVHALPSQISIENIVDFAKAQRVCIIYYSVLQNGRELERSSLNRTRTRMLAWVVSSFGVVTCHPFFVPDSLAHLVEMTRRCMGASERIEVRSAADSVPALDTDLLQKEMGSLLAAEGPTNKLLRRCHDTFIAPLEQEVASERRLVIVPDQELYALPFAALLDTDGKHLIQKFSIRLAPSIGAIVEIGKRAIDEGAVRALVVGGPDYTSWTNSSGEHLSELTGARKEAKEVAHLLEKVFPDDDNDLPTVDRRVGKMATKAAVTAALGLSKLVHLAAHGEAQSIYLAGPNAEDATLTMGEVQQMTLSARLVVLSACDSFGGKLGTDGVVGVSRAFLAAGAQTVVSSLWKVSDTATLELMKRFYQKLISITDPAEAMQAAMVSMVVEEAYKVLDWASFVVYGMVDLPAPVMSIEAVNERSGGGGSSSDDTRAKDRPHPYARSVTNDRIKCAVSGPSEVARNLTTFTLRAWVLLQDMMADLKEELEMYKQVLQSTSTKKAAGAEKLFVEVLVTGCEVSNAMTLLPCPSDDEPLMHSHHQVMVPGDFSADRFDCTVRITTEDMSKDFLNTSFSLPRVASTAVSCDFLQFSAEVLAANESIKVRLDSAEQRLGALEQQARDVIAGQQQLRESVRKIAMSGTELDQLNQAVVALGVGFGTMPPKVQNGTGFFVHVDGYLVTDHHVLLHMDHPTGASRKYFVGIGSPIVWTWTAKVLDWSPTAQKPRNGKLDHRTAANAPWLDLCVMKLESLLVAGAFVPFVGPVPALVLGDSDTIATGQPVWVLGYGQQQHLNGGVNPTTHTCPGAFAGRDQDLMQEHAPSELLMVTADMLAGHSGGPAVVRQNDQLVVIGWNILSLGDPVRFDLPTFTQVKPADRQVGDIPLSATPLGELVAKTYWLRPQRITAQEMCGGLHGVRPINLAKPMLVNKTLWAP